MMICGKTRLRDCVTAPEIGQRFNQNGICMVALFRHATKKRDFSYSIDTRNLIGLNNCALLCNHLVTQPITNDIYASIESKGLDYEFCCKSQSARWLQRLNNAAILRKPVKWYRLHTNCDEATNTILLIQCL